MANINPNLFAILPQLQLSNGGSVSNNPETTLAAIILGQAQGDQFHFNTGNALSQPQSQWGSEMPAVQDLLTALLAKQEEQEKAKFAKIEARNLSYMSQISTGGYDAQVNEELHQKILDTMGTGDG